MFPFWMFIYIAVIGAIPIAIGMIPVPEANDASTVAGFARWYANHRWWLALVWYVLLTVTPLGVTAFWNYKHPDIQAQATLDFDEGTSQEYGFHWIRSPELDDGRLSWIVTKRQSSGLMWKGHTMVVSRSDDKISSFALLIYGSDQGVGHYVWIGGESDMGYPYHGEGHIPMASYNYYEQDRDIVKKRGVMHHAIEKASATLNQHYRPLEIRRDKKTSRLDIYDPVSGRDVYYNSNAGSRNDRFVFGPYPTADGPYVKQPGLKISEVSSSTSTLQLIFRVQDVYRQPINRVVVSINSETGYRYAQTLPDDASDMTITLPLFLPHVQVEISRGGYHTLSADVALNQNIQRVEAVLEPQRRR